MNQRIYIVRHGNREDFEDRSWTRRAERPYDPGLSTDGVQQAREVGRVLAQRSIDRVFASPFLRTLQTALFLSEEGGFPVFVEPGLGEILPTLSEMPALLGEEERLERFPHLRSDYETYGKLAYPESEDAGHARSAATVAALASRYPNETLLCVTHASPVVGIVRGLCGIQEKIRVPLCALFVIEHSEDGWSLVQNGDVSYLSDPETSQKHAHVG